MHPRVYTYPLADGIGRSWVDEGAPRGRQLRPGVQAPLHARHRRRPRRLLLLLGLLLGLDGQGRYIAYWMKVQILSVTVTPVTVTNRLQ